MPAQPTTGPLASPCSDEVLKDYGKSLLCSMHSMHSPMFIYACARFRSVLSLSLARGWLAFHCPHLCFPVSLVVMHADEITLYVLDLAVWCHRCCALLWQAGSSLWMLYQFMSLLANPH